MSVLALSLLALLQAAPPEREKASGFTFVRAKGWARNALDNGAIALQPPGGDALECSLFIFPGQDNADIAEDTFHDKMFEALTQASKVAGKIDKSTKGAWRVSVARVIAAQEQESWIAVYTAKSGNRVEVLMFVCKIEKLFATHRPAVDAMVASVEFTAPARRPAIHGLIIPHPADWTRKDDASGAVYLVPPQIPTALNYLLCILAPIKLQGTHWDTHKALVKALLDQAQWKGGEPVVVHKVEGPGIFIKTGAAGRTAAGEGREFTLFTAAHDGVMEAVIGLNSIDRNVVDPVLKATTFKDPPKAGASPKIAEAYRRLNQRMTINPQGGAMVAGSLMYDRLWLRADGVADFSSLYTEGYAASPLPMKVDPSLQNGDYGSWKRDGDKIHVTRSAGAKPLVFEKTDGGVKGDGKDWETMPRVDGLKLSGRWEIKSPPEEKVTPYHHWIEFTPEGRFKVDGVLKFVAFGDVDPYRPPDKAAGTYEIRDWTMFFKFDDGTSWSTDFSILGREIAPDMSILFRASVFMKAK
jgi:hypothetical protein